LRGAHPATRGSRQDHNQGGQGLGRHSDLLNEIKTAQAFFFIAINKYISKRLNRYAKGTAWEGVRINSTEQKTTLMSVDPANKGAGNEARKQ
jgi:hypothetical protein